MTDFRVKSFWTAICLCFATCFVLFVVGGAQAKNVLNKASSKIDKIYYQDNNLLINFSGSKPQTKHFTLASSRAGFVRFVLDMQNSQITQESIEGSSTQVNIDSRISQFSHSPAIVRIVIEAPEEFVAGLLIKSKPNQLVVQNSNQAASSSSNSSSGDKTQDYKLSTINKVSFENNQLVVQGSYAIKKNVFPLKTQGKQMLVIDLKEANLGNTDLAKTFSAHNTHSSEKIRIAQFAPGTVRVVVEGKQADFWQANLQDEDKQLMLQKGNTTSSNVASNSSSQESNLTKPKTAASNLTLQNGDSASITITNLAEQRIKYKYFSMHSPERLVLDLYNWDEDPTKLIPGEELKALIIAVRAGRPSHDKSVARLVFDLSQKDINITDQISDDKKTLYLNLQAKEKTDSLSRKLSKVRKNAKVVLDAGHGGYDAGAIYSSAEEKSVTLEIAKKTEKILEAQKIEVVQTRTDDRFVSLDERVEITKKAKPDAFVSIHCNALESSSKIYGLESYYFTQQSHQLSKILHKNLVRKTRSLDRGVRKARFVVIRETNIPSALLEVGFLSNPKERSKLQSNNYQNTVAEAIANGIIEYLNTLK